MSSRLNNRIRDAIVENALKKSGYAAGCEAYEGRRNAFIEALRLVGLGIDADQLAVIQTKIEKLRQSIPEQVRGTGTVLNKRYGFRLNAGGERERYRFADDQEHVTADEITIPSGHLLFDEREALKAEDARLKAMKESITGPVRAAVNAVSTVKALLNVWPEAKELLPEALPEAKAQLPALHVEELNALVGLPTLDAPAPVE